MGEDPAHGGGHGGGVAPRHDPRGVGEQLEVGGDVAGDDATAARHRLGDDEGLALLERRREQCPRMVVEQSDDRGILDPEESHPLPRGRGLAMERQLGLTARAAGRAHDREIDVGRGVAAARQLELGVDRDLDALLRHESPDGDEGARSRRPSSASTSTGAGVGRVTPLDTRSVRDARRWRDTRSSFNACDTASSASEKRTAAHSQ